MKQVAKQEAWGDEWAEEPLYDIALSERMLLLYRGTPSQDPNAFRGFDFELLDPEKTEDFHEFKEEVFEAWAAVERGERDSNSVIEQLHGTSIGNWERGPSTHLFCLDCSDTDAGRYAIFGRRR